VIATVPFTVLGGYLGAGKTTLLNRLLHDNQGQRLALLINDFGAINIDAELIESKSDQQINLPNGCVCCGLSDGFDEAISQLLASDPPPDHIVVEASGVADVATLSQYGRTPGMRLDAVVVVADATTVQQKARDKYVAKTVQRQLRAANLLVLNKSDLVSAERLQELKEWLTTLNPAASVVCASYCALPASLLLGSSPGGSTEHPSTDADQPHTGAHHEQYCTWSWEQDGSLTDDQLRRFFTALPDSVIRGKGVALVGDQLKVWQRVGNQEDLQNAAADRASGANGTRLVAIGLADQLQPNELDKLASKYLTHGHT